MRITSKGQVTIPIAIRQRMGFLPETEVEFRVEGNSVVLVKAKKTKETRGDRLISKMRGKATVRMSTDEIMALTRG